MRSTIISAIFLLFACQLYGQWNMKAGYRFGITDPAVFNDIIHNYNSSVDINFYNEGGFKDLTFFHGADLGVSFRGDNIGLEIGWIHKRRQLRAEGSYANSSNNYRNRITTSINSASAGLVSYFGQFRVGGTIDYNEMKIKGDFERRQNELAPKVFKDKSHAWSSHFSVGYTFKTSSVIALSIQPYVQIYWNDYSLDAFDDLLNLDNPTEPRPLKEKFGAFGIAFIIYNGPQR